MVTCIYVQPHNIYGAQPSLPTAGMLYLSRSYLVPRNMVPALQTTHSYRLSHTVEKTHLSTLQAAETAEEAHTAAKRIYMWLQTVLESSRRQSKQNIRCTSLLVISVEHKMMQQQQATQPSTYNEIFETEYDIITVEGKRGDETTFTPKVVSRGSEYAVYFRTAPVSVLYSKLGEGGDALGDHAKFNKPLDQACATLTLVQGCAFSKVTQTMPTLLENQKKTFEILKKQHTDLMIEAFNNKKVKCSGKEKARKKATGKLKKGGNKKPTDEQINEAALQIYIEDSMDSGLKELTWTNNGEENTGEVLKIKRKIRGVRYVKPEGGTQKERTLVETLPMFHRGNITGEYYEKKYGDYVPRNTLLIPRVRRNFYTTPMMYGSNLTFDKDIVVLCEPKKRKSVVSKPVIFFEDEDADTPSKKQRTE